MTIEPTTTLGDLVTAHPAVARDLERHGLDYCCGGTRTLGDACAARGLDSSAIIAELSNVISSAAEPPVDWATMGVLPLVDHIESTHHVPLWPELERLTALVEKIANVHGERHPELAEVRDTFEKLRAELEPHLSDEERTVFPAIRHLATDSAAPVAPLGLLDSLSTLVGQHDQAGELLEQLRELSHDYDVPADGCPTYRATYEGLAEFEADLHLHVHKENNVLFPAVQRLGQHAVQAAS